VRLIKRCDTSYRAQGNAVVTSAPLGPVLLTSHATRFNMRARQRHEERQSRTERLMRQGSMSSNRHVSSEASLAKSRVTKALFLFFFARFHPTRAQDTRKKKREEIHVRG